MSLCATWRSRALLEHIMSIGREESLFLTVSEDHRKREYPEYVQRMSFGFDCRCFFGTAISALRGDGVVEGGTGELHRMENKQ